MKKVLVLLVLSSFLLVSGCCKTCPPPKIVPVYKSCKLPPKVLLEFPDLVKMGCPDGLVCFSKDEFPKLISTIDRMVLWIKMARTRCEKPVPATQPVE